MGQRARLTDEAIGSFLTAHPGWAREGEALVRSYAFADYAAGIAFVVRVGFAAEARDHHPDMIVGYRRVQVSWSTHDAGGITARDTELAERCDALSR